METRLTRLLGIKHPIISAAMSSHSGARLAAAVSNAGALGMFGAALKPAAWLRTEAVLARSLTDAPFGVGFITHRDLDEEAFEAALDEGVQVMAFPFAYPPAWVDRARTAGRTVICQAMSVEQAREAVAAGTDVLVVQGVEGGGHTGPTPILTLLEQVLNAHPEVPVVAAGGIGSGRALAAVLAAGADGAWMGTRFLATEEAVEVAPEHKDLIVRSDGRDTAFTPIWDKLAGTTWPQGVGARGYANTFYREWAGREQELADQVSDIRLEWEKRRSADRFEHGNVFMGLSAAAVTSVLPAATVVDQIVAEAEELLSRWR